MKISNNCMPISNCAVSDDEMNETAGTHVHMAADHSMNLHLNTEPGSDLKRIAAAGSPSVDPQNPQPDASLKFYYTAGCVSGSAAFPRWASSIIRMAPCETREVEHSPVVTQRVIPRIPGTT